MDDPDQPEPLSVLDAIERGSRLLGIAIRLTGLLAYEFEWHAIEQWPRSQPSESGVGPAICLEYQEGFAPIVDLMDLGEHIAKADLVYWFTILVAVNLQTSFLTPPFGFALFYMKGAAGDLVSMREIYRGIVPFVMLQVAVLFILIWQPELAMWLPNKVLDH